MGKKHNWGMYILVLIGIVVLSWGIGTIIVSVNG